MTNNERKAFLSLVKAVARLGQVAHMAATQIPNEEDRNRAMAYLDEAGARIDGAVEIINKEWSSSKDDSSKPKLPDVTGPDGAG